MKDCRPEDSISQQGDNNTIHTFVRPTAQEREKELEMTGEKEIEKLRELERLKEIRMEIQAIRQRSDKLMNENHHKNIELQSIMRRTATPPPRAL